MLSCFAATWNAAFGQRTAIVNTAWLPVTDAERQTTAPTVEKNAGAEALFWRVHVVDEMLGHELQRVLYHYVRLKIFNEEGAKNAATIDIQYGDRVSIMYIDGRTIKADGSILELDRKSIHDRDLVRAGGLKRKVTSFGMAGVEPGVIVEYRWKEVRHDPRVMYTRLQFQREFPVRKVTYFIKPLPQDYTSYKMSVWPFNCKPSPLELERDGFNSTSLENVPAFKDEPMMPAEANVRPWLLIFYRQDGMREPDKYWEEVGRQAFREMKRLTAVNNDIKRAAATAIEGALDPEAKLLQLIRYMRRNFRNLWDSDVTDAERGKVIREMPKSRYRNAAEIFKSGIGTADELNTLFAALASEAGLDARPAHIASRNDVYFHEKMAERYFLRNIDMAVKFGGEWKIFDVSAKLLPPGLLHWYEEGVRALIADPRTPGFVTTPLSPPEASATVRSAKLVLTEDGTLEGEIEETHTGHAAAVRREDFEAESEARQQEEMKEQLTGAFPQAEVTAVVIRNAADPEKPLEIGYRIRIPSYAQRTGRRILFQPLYFQRGAGPTFTAGERMHDIQFRYAWKETDRITLELPEGYVLDNAENPGSLAFGAPGAYTLEMKVNTEGKVEVLRELLFGKGGMFIFPRTSYGQLKTVFDEIHRRDTTTIAIRRAGQ